MKTIVFTVLFSAMSAQICAQNTFVKGYIISEKGDTVRGEVRINPKKESDNYYKVFFKDATGMQKNYKPEKTKGYGFDNKHFVALEVDAEFRYLEVVVKGPLSLYKIMQEVMKMNELFFEAEYYLVKEGENKPQAVKESKFKKQIAEFMKDNPEIASSYSEEKKFDLEKATELIKSYNAWKSGK